MLSAYVEVWIGPLEEEKTQSDVPEYPARADKPDQNFKA